MSVVSLGWIQSKNAIEEGCRKNYYRCFSLLVAAASQTDEHNLIIYQR
jgi:hypothetical protein